MILTIATLNKSSGLISKIGEDDFELCNNASDRMVLLYGDALSVNNHSQIPMKIHRKLTTIGNEAYIVTFLDCHKSIVMQKGLFHQLMHQSAVIYSIFYGGFQATQASLVVKRVTVVIW